jgi:hypothetical protein
MPKAGARRRSLETSTSSLGGGSLTGTCWTSGGSIGVGCTFHARLMYAGYH